MRAILGALLLLVLLPSGAARATSVLMETVLGDIELELFDDTAPQTVANFLGYVTRGDYDNSFFHRSARFATVPAVIQGGGFRIVNGTDLGRVPEGPIVENEFGASNLRGTIAMARLAGVENSARSQFFFNVIDNPSFDGQDGGFTVFGFVSSGLDVMDAISNLPRTNASNVLPAFAELPILSTTGTQPLRERLVMIERMSVIPEPTTALLLGAGLAALGARRRVRV